MKNQRSPRLYARMKKDAYALPNTSHSKSLRESFKGLGWAKKQKEECIQIFEMPQVQKRSIALVNIHAEERKAYLRGIQKVRKAELTYYDKKKFMSNERAYKILKAQGFFKEV